MVLTRTAADAVYNHLVDVLLDNQSENQLIRRAFERDGIITLEDLTSLAIHDIEDLVTTTVATPTQPSVEQPLNRGSRTRVRLLLEYISYKQN